MPSPDRLSTADQILESFGAETGLTSEAQPRRYLWTDAYAVCTWLGLHRRWGEERHLQRARALVEQVHRVLGRHRPDDTRSGWISGLDEEEGARHPTAGGLRIGKELPEREPGQPMDPRLDHAGESLGSCLPGLAPFLSLADRLETFWSGDEQRSASTWTDHLDINRISLAASLVPEGWFG